MKNSDAFMVGVLAGALAAVVLCGITARFDNAKKRDEAMRAGVAEWRIDPRTGETEFVYLTPQEIAARIESEATP